MTTIIEKAKGGFIRQFSVWIDNTTGRLNGLLAGLHSQGIHLLALATLAFTECMLVRLVTDDPNKAYNFLLRSGYGVKITEVIGVQLETEADLQSVTAVLANAEVQVHFAYAFIQRPHGKAAFVLGLEDNELCCEALGRHAVKVLLEADLLR